MKPVTQYTKSGHLNIAYQVFGSGSTDLVYIPGWVSNIDWMWACPELVNFLQELGNICRVILFDKRGTGLSDRVVELSTLEERMDDVRAVMDAVGSKKAILFGHSEGGSVSALFAATYPNRTISLITFGVFAKRRYSPEYPWAPTDEERKQVYDMIEHSWGGGNMNLASLAPSKANDKEFMDWLANYFRSGASPSAALVLTKMNTEVDIIDILGAIKVPTLMMQRVHDIDVKIEEGRFIAERISGARFVEFQGNDHLFWVGNTKEILETMSSFILESRPDHRYEKRLYNIVSAKILTSATNTDAFKDLVQQYVLQYRGRLVETKGHGFTAIFEGPSKAVHCCLDLIRNAHQYQVQLVIGIHIREFFIEVAHSLSSEAKVFAETLLKHGKPNQILITQTVRNLLSGAGLQFVRAESVFDAESGDAILLFGVTDHLSSGRSPVTPVSHSSGKRDSFLEMVLQQIEQHLSDELFGVDRLCKEIGISERQLQRKLKAITNKSPNQLISSVRLHKAKELLRTDQYTIAEVAFKTGFSNPSYFSKSFRKEFSISPSEL